MALICYFCSYNNSQSAVLRKPNIYKEIDVSKVITQIWSLHAGCDNSLFHSSWKSFPLSKVRDEKNSY